MRLLLATAVLLALGGSALALPGNLEGTAEDQAAWTAVEEGKWVRARELGEKILRDDPGSWAGHYVLGMAMHYGEGDLARSVVHLEKSAALFERRYTPIPPPSTPWRWHEAALRELGYSLNEMDRPAEYLAVLDRYDRVYQPKRFAFRVWPLMKLRRYDEARAAAKLAISVGKQDQQTIARSDLCAAEFEAGNRTQAHEACTAALVQYRSRSSGGQIEFSNASEASMAIFRFDEAERFLNESARRVSYTSWGNPYQRLAELYLLEGRIPEAVAALKSAQDLRTRRPAWLDQHGQSRLDWTVAAMLVVSGFAERAVQVAERAVNRPDRQGVHSATEAQARSASVGLLAIALRERARREEEDAHCAGFVEGVKLKARSLRTRFAAWSAEREVAVLFADERFLVGTLRPYWVGGAEASEWMVPYLLEMAGGGVVLRGLERARAAEQHPTAAAYFDAFEAQARFTQRDWRAALDAAQRSLDKLPTAEALLSGRMAAIAAESARRLGRSEVATQMFARAMTRFPGALRALDVRLPVRVESDGSPVAEAASAIVRGSPRFVEGEGHFVSLRARGDGAEACLYGPMHAMVACETVKLDEKQTTKERARALAAELHRAAFAFKTELTQADLTTLDGSPTAARADRQIRTLLDSLAPVPATGPPPPR